MARVTVVHRARKDQGPCGRCGVEIKRGDPYRHASPGFRARKLVRCMKSECSFRQSELTTSNMSSAYAGLEDAESILAEAITAQDLVDACQAAIDGLNESREMYEEANDAWAGGMSTNPEWDERIDDLNAAVSVIEDAMSECEQFEPHGGEEGDGDPDDDQFEELRANVEAAIQEAWL